MLPVLFAVCFIVPHPKAATNLYRLLIVLPMLLCFRPSDLREIWANVPVRWFLLLSAWMTLTLFWDGASYKDLKLFWRELNVFALFYLFFLIGKYHPEKFDQIDKSFLIFGVLGALLVLYDWDGLTSFQTSWHHTESARGVFHHHAEVGWIMAVLAIISLDKWLGTERLTGRPLAFTACCFFIVITFWVQARGGYVLLAAGLMALLVLNPGRKTNLVVLAGCAAVIVLTLIFKQELLSIWGKIFARGTAGRMFIWENGFNEIVDTWFGLLFGHGLSVSAENQVGSFTAAHYHNFFINQTFYSGLVGLGLYLGFLLALLYKALRFRHLWLWGVVLLAMQVAFIADGDRLWVNPSAMMLCVLMPMARIVFDRGIEAGKMTMKDFRQIFRLSHLMVLSGALLFSAAVIFWLSVAAGK